MGEFYLEIVPVDKALRVTAVDSDTGLEVVFAAPQHTARERIDALAVAKLKARIAREEQAAKSAVPSVKERGKLV